LEEGKIEEGKELYQQFLPKIEKIYLRKKVFLYPEYHGGKGRGQPCICPPPPLKFWKKSKLKKGRNFTNNSYQKLK
jgi:hypothetical protein